MSSVKQAIILKGNVETSEHVKDPYAEKIEALNIKCYVIPVLSFEFINEDILKSHLNSPEKYTGVVFSSPRCVDAVKPYLKPDDWANKDIYVVGHKTAQSAASLGLTGIKGQDTGNGLALANFILSEKKDASRLLVPASNIGRDVLVNRLQEHEFEVDHVVAYRTLPNPNLETLLTPLLKDQHVDIMLFFSPSGVDAAYPFLTKYDKTSTISFGAIGTTTADALKKHSLKVSFVAEQPNPDYVVNALQSVLQ